MKSTVKTIEKGEKIIVPNAENMTPEEIKKFKHKEKVRRYTARQSGKEVVEQVSNHELRKIDTETMVEIAKDTRNKAVQLLDKKLNMLNEDDEELKKVNMATLATVFGILFDKAQLAAGLATENIAIHAKIDINMNADAAMSELNKMREKFSENNTG
jgi:hypothetical protein